jgi:pilus assembly protein CpaE
LPPAAAQGRRLVLLGSRVGMGVTTLATHMAALAARTSGTSSAAPGARLAANGAAAAGQPEHRVALLDLGLPAGDGLLYLNESSTFHFAEAVRNLQRFDQTLVQTALTHSSYGATVISLPRDLAEMRMVTHADSLALMNQLRLYFDFLITDLNGSANFEFIAKMVQDADETWVVSDQSIGSIVSLADLLGELAQKKIGPERLRLVVNRYDERYGMAAEQIAERFSLQLAGTVPDRALALLRSANLGQLLVKSAEQDPYVRAVRGLVEQLRQPEPGARKSSATKLGLGGLRSLFASR